MDQTHSGPEIHPHLAALQGKWQGKTRTWFQPGVLADESEHRGEFHTISGCNTLEWKYQGSMEGNPFHGFALLGYDKDSGLFQFSWTDSFHMSACLLISEGSETPRGFWVKGTYGAGPGEPRWGWRTEFEIEGQNELIIRAFNILPEGAEALAVETKLARQQ